jgi:hypothetical protein
MKPPKIEIPISSPCEKCFCERQMEDADSVFVYCPHRLVGSLWRKAQEQLFPNWMTIGPVSEFLFTSWKQAVLSALRDSVNPGKGTVH